MFSGSFFFFFPNRARILLDRFYQLVSRRITLWPQQFILKIHECNTTYNDSPKIVPFLPCPGPCCLFMFCPHTQSYCKYLKLSEDFLALFTRSLSVCITASNTYQQCVVFLKDSQSSPEKGSDMQACF